MVPPDCGALTGCNQTWPVICAAGSAGPGLLQRGSSTTARRSASVAARSSSNGRGNGGGLLDWLQAGKMLKDVVLARVFAPDAEAAGPASYQAEQAQVAVRPPLPVQQQQQEHTTHVQHATRATAAQQWQQQPPAQVQAQPQPQPQPQYHSSMNGTAGTAAVGPIKASASTLLAGVPLQEMRERQQAAQQLQRLQEQHLGGRGTSSPGAAAPSPSPSPTPSSGSAALWGSTLAARPSSPSGSAAPQAPAGSEAGANGSGSGRGSEGSGSASSLRAELSPVTSPEAAVAFAAYERAVSARRMVPVRLVLQLQAAEGQRVKVVGGHKSLGEGRRCRACSCLHVWPVPVHLHVHSLAIPGKL